MVILATLMLGTMNSCNKSAAPQMSDIPDKTLSDDDLQNYQYLFSEATKNKVLGDIPKAIDYFQKCLLISPESDASMYALSSLYSMVGEYERSLEYAEKAAQNDPDNLWYLLQLANLYRAMNLLDKSIQVYEGIHLKFPDRDDLYFTLGNLYAENKQHTKAIEIFSRLENQYGFQENVILAKEEAFEDTQQYDKAEKEIDKLIRVFPENVQYNLMRAEILYIMGRIKESESLYGIIEKEHPESDLLLISRIGFYREQNDTVKTIQYVTALIMRESLDVDAKLQFMAALLNDTGDIKFLETHIEELLMTLRERHPEDIRTTALIADYYVKVNDYKNASVFYRDYIANDKANYLAWERLLYIENILENYNDLYRYSHEASTIFRNAPLVYFFKGLACTELNRNAEAVPIFLKGLELVEGDDELMIQFYAIIGDAYRNLGEYERSDQAFEKALEINPENSIILNNYSYYLALRNEDLKRALKMSARTIKQEPLNATYLDTYGWILFKLGKYKQARKYVGKAVTLDQDPSAEVLEHYGDIMEKTGDAEQAIKYWELAQQAGETSETIIEKINRLKNQL